MLETDVHLTRDGVVVVYHDGASSARPTARARRGARLRGAPPARRGLRLQPGRRRAASRSAARACASRPSPRRSRRFPGARFNLELKGRCRRSSTASLARDRATPDARSARSLTAGDDRAMPRLRAPPRRDRARDRRRRVARATCVGFVRAALAGQRAAAGADGAADPGELRRPAARHARARRVRARATTCRCTSGRSTSRTRCARCSRSASTAS